jgi:signal transduction histidine kinase
MVKIGILSLIQIIFIIIIFAILVYFQSQQTLLGNTINIAGKERFLTSNLLYQISEFIPRSMMTTMATTTTTNYAINNISQIKSAELQLESNIMILKNGGNISNIQVQPIPSKFINNWNSIHEKWIGLKAVLAGQIYKNSIENRQSTTIKNSTLIPSINTTAYSLIKKEITPFALDIINSSDILVTQLGKEAEKNIQDMVMLQIILGISNVLLIIFVLFLVRQLLKPVNSLTKATSEVEKGNLEVSVNYKGKDELSSLTESFNSMISTINNQIKKQTELTNELIQLNTQLNDANRLKDDFINIAAHELRNPVQSIVVSTSILVNKTNDLQQKKLIDVVKRNSKKLKSIIQNLLDASRIESNSLNLTKEKFYFNEVVLNIIKDYEDTLYTFQNFKILFHSSDNEFVIYADKDRIIQVISNLIDNSIKFIPAEGGIISITTEKIKTNSFDMDSKEIIVVTVKDSGSGIDKEILPRLFTKFSSKSFQGIGLGLYICKSIIEAHGGKIWAENDKDGFGSIFYFTLPLDRYTF